MNKPKDYRGGIFATEGRRIELGESVRVNASGALGAVVDMMEGEFVMEYTVAFEKGPDRRFRTDQITPVENP